MTATQALEFKQLLERRRAGIRAQIREKIRAVREQKRVLDASRSRTAFTDDVADDDVDLGIVRVQGQILARIKAALARLEAVDVRRHQRLDVLRLLIQPEPAGDQ